MKKKKNLSLPLLFGVFIFFFGCVIGVLGMFVILTMTDKPPQFFPLDDLKGTYKIIQLPRAFNTNTEVKPEELKVEEKNPPLYYLIEYRGAHVFSDRQNTNYFAVIVGNSPVDLKPYIGHFVHMKGNFVTRSVQCIARKCTDIKGPWVVFDIDKIVLAQ